MRKALTGTLMLPLVGLADTQEYLIGQGMYTIFHLIDWGQTLYIAQSPRYREMNPVLGRDPSEGKVNLYFGTTLVMHWALGYLAYRMNKTLFWSYILSTTSVEAYTTGRNFSLGVSMRF